MVQTVASSQAGAVVSTFRDEYTKAFRWMLLARTLDDKFAGLYRAGKIHGGVFLGRGQEALSVSIGLALRKGDVFAPLIRDGAGRLAFGEPMLDAVRTYLGSALGPMRAQAAVAAVQQDGLTAIKEFYNASIALTITLHLDSTVMLVPHAGAMAQTTLV